MKLFFSLDYFVSSQQLMNYLLFFWLSSWFLWRTSVFSQLCSSLLSPPPHEMNFLWVVVRKCKFDKDETNSKHDLLYQMSYYTWNHLLIDRESSLQCGPKSLKIVGLILGTFNHTVPNLRFLSKNSTLRQTWFF